MLSPIDFVDQRAPYPTVTDFFRTFNEEMHSLYLLSFLLTADMIKPSNVLFPRSQNARRGSAVSWIAHVHGLGERF
jgi:hypothetical protein